MPICTTCARSVPYLYTVYQSAHNLRLEHCANCRNFADPYVEHDEFILLLDLILLKRGVFRHLLFNRGYPPRQAELYERARSPVPEKKLALDHRQSLTIREKERWRTIAKLGLGTIFVDALACVVIRWSHLRVADYRSDDGDDWTMNRLLPFIRMFVGCAIETLAFHFGITLACAAVLKLSKPKRSPEQASNRPKEPSPTRTLFNEFRLSHVPLTLLYSSLTKLFLLLLLSVWKPTTEAHLFPRRYSGNDTIYDSWIVQNALQLLDEDKLDREWVVRNVLGGMSAGFGLRVVLDIHPVFTTLIVLFGWVVKTAVANLVHPWVNIDKEIGEAFLAYSIP